MTDEHFTMLCRYETELAAQGFQLIGGVDEAGRGPLAGPVVAACVLFPSEGPFPRADDSKKLKPEKREVLYQEIIDTAVAVGIGISDHVMIDEMNILQATYAAMRQAAAQAAAAAYERRGQGPEMLLVDHVRIPGIEIPQLPITHGDALSVSIGAASIIAKVTRDRLMTAYAAQYPQYGFEKHKGYGTKQHYEAIAVYGMCGIHRRSFLKKVISAESEKKTAVPAD